MDATKIIQAFLGVLFLPFLQQMIEFAWGAGDSMELAIAKRVFILLPIGAIIVAYWISMISIPSLVIRADRRAYMTSLLVTWWDLGRAVMTFWGGTFRFIFAAVTSVMHLLRFVVVGFWVLLQDIVLIPFRVLGNIGENVMNQQTPWIAVGLTMFWCTLEAVIFTYVTTPLVIDTLSNMTGSQLSESFIRIPLFLFMIFIVLGSYSVLSTWAAAMATKDVPSILKITVIELVAMFVEVVFLYREFVDALVPWFAQHSAGEFELGVFGTIGIAGITWVGIRALSWFLFAQRGTPTLMAIIQGNAMTRSQRVGGNVTPLKGSFQITQNFFTQLKSESAWIQSKGEELVGAFVLPPLHVVAAAINFCTLLFISHHIFDLPFRSISELKDAKDLITKAHKGARPNTMTGS